ncbi:FkbM family methyltransferase [Methylacidiphilum caldifontis]|uniref:FkbM family methyltransferase n=1 Tax=Methylacidiphilum caldifontis TaxID=2795386 RepID=UPI001A8D7C04|nr:FkbM family methyltransferase [Methylacidiphilum caldifontis]QSR88579.1 FkbM family methyltransferase [Methylacidiphilum caldifontis]
MINNLYKKSKKFLFNISNPFFWKGLQYGVYAGAEHKSLLKNLHCKTIIDIGANRGQFSLMAKYLFPNAIIFAFEPLPIPASVFRKIFKNDPTVHLIEAGIGRKKETRPFYVSYQDDSSSFLPIGENQLRVFPKTGHKETINVPIAPLTQWINKNDIVNPTLLKIDVQGYELDVLYGSEDLLPFFSYVYVESSFCELYLNQALADDIIIFLNSYRFKLKGIYNLYYDKYENCIQGDFFFKNMS